jgi:hypothetical protein
MRPKSPLGSSINNKKMTTNSGLKNFMKNFSMVERNLRKSQTNVKEHIEDIYNDSLLQTEPNYNDDYLKRNDIQLLPGQETKYTEGYEEISREKKFRLHPLKLKFTPLVGDKRNFLANFNLNKSMNFDVMKSKDQTLCHNNSNENIFNNSSLKFNLKTNNTYKEKKIVTSKTRNRNLSENYDPTYFNNVISTHQNINTNQFNNTQINHVSTDQMHQLGLPRIKDVSVTGNNLNNTNYSFDQSLIINNQDNDQNRKKADPTGNKRKTDLNVIKSYYKKVTPTFFYKNTSENANSSIDFGLMMERRGSSNLKKSNFNPNTSYDNENFISAKLNEEKQFKTELLKSETNLKIDKERKHMQTKLDSSNLKLEIHRENEISICNNIYNKNKTASKEKYLKNENKRSPSYLQVGNENKNLHDTKDSSLQLKTKTICFDKKTINYSNNLLTDTQDGTTITRINTNTKEKDETFNFNPNMDCIEDLHFEFVKFCIKSKKIIKYQESAMRTCIDDFNTVIAVEEVDLI